MILKRALLAFSACSMFLFCSCGGSGGDDTNFLSAHVVDIQAVDDSLEVGEGTVVAVDFTFDPFLVFDDGRNVVVTVRLPEGLDYRDNTSEVDGESADREIGAQVTFCPNSGETFLVYDMDDVDLEGAQNPPGEALARLTLTVDAIGRTSDGVVARADSDIPDDICSRDFFGDEGVFIDVL